MPPRTSHRRVGSSSTIPHSTWSAPQTAPSVTSLQYSLEPRPSPAIDRDHRADQPRQRGAKSSLHPATTFQRRASCDRRSPKSPGNSSGSRRFCYDRLWVDPIVPATFTNTRAAYRTENWQVRSMIDVARPCQPMLRNGPVAENFEDRNTIHTVTLTNPQPGCHCSKTRPERAAVQSPQLFLVSEPRGLMSKPCSMETSTFCDPESYLDKLDDVFHDVRHGNVYILLGGLGKVDKCPRLAAWERPAPFRRYFPRPASWKRRQSARHSYVGYVRQAVAEVHLA